MATSTRCCLLALPLLAQVAAAPAGPATDGSTAASAAAPCPGPKLCGTCPGLPDMNIDGRIVHMNTSEFCNVCHHQHIGDDDDNQPVRALCGRRRVLEVGHRYAGTGVTVSVAVFTLTKTERQHITIVTC